MPFDPLCVLLSIVSVLVTSVIAFGIHNRASRSITSHLQRIEEAIASDSRLQVDPQKGSVVIGGQVIMLRTIAGSGSAQAGSASVSGVGAVTPRMK